MSIVLKFSSILNVPLQNYCNDFTFVVNNQEFKTSHLIADLLSPKISQIHLNDPTCDRFIIHTQCKGDFSHILQLIKFNELSIPTNEIEFFNEIIEKFGYANFDITISEEPINFTIDNVFSHIKNYGKKNSFSKRRYESAIEFISAHFTEVIDSHQEEMFQLEDDVLDDVLSHPKLKLNTEDELLSFLNELYQKDSKFSILYKNMEIEITSYAIKSTQSDKGCAHIKNWSIEISNDGKKWEKIDEHSNYAELNGPDIVKTFDVSPRIFARYCRFVHNNDYYGNLNYNLGLNSIEFYGKLKEQ